MTFKSLNELDPSEGTVQLFSDNSNQQHLGNSNLVLIPQPSEDPNDPLRLPTWRKHAAFLSVCLFTCLNNFTGTVLSDSFLTVSEDLGVSLEEASGLISWVIFASGLSNFIWVPAAIYLGKRPIFLFSCTISFLGSVWAAASTSFGSLQAACVIGGFAGGASEALCAAMINELYFLHERGSKMACFVIALAWGSSLGPLCGGYIIEELGWAWGKWISAILLGINVLLIFFLSPETRFRRPTESPDGLNYGLPNSATSSSQASNPDLSHVGQSKPVILHLEETHSRLSGGDEKRQQPLQPSNDAIRSEKRSYFENLNPWSGVQPDVSFWILMFRPMPLLAYPACMFAALTFSIGLAPTVMMNILSSAILIPPPYQFSIGSVGLMNVPGIIGQGAGAIIGGVCLDKWTAYRARRNNGIFVPETRLLMIIVPVAITVTGIILFGFAVQNQMHWAVIFTAYGMTSVALTASPGIAMTYVSDNYFPVAAECLEMINGIKNVVVFGFIEATVPWAQEQGFVKTFGTLGALHFAVMSAVIPLYFWGKQIRHYTSWRWRLISWDME